MSEQLTDAEMIATRLLGWVLHKAGTDFRRGAAHAHRFNAEGDPDDNIFYRNADPCADWPDLTDWRGIRRMEEEIAKRYLLDEYDDHLNLIAGNQTHQYAYTATAEQRVQAALRLIESENL